MLWKGPNLLNRYDVRTSLKNALFWDQKSTKRTYTTENLVSSARQCVIH